MADVEWIKIATGIFDNRKIKQIEIMPDGDTILIIWFKLICLAGTINDNGTIYLTPEIPYTDEMLAAQFGRPLPIIRLALNTFKAFGMIEMVNNFIFLPSWDKYQNSDKLATMRSKNAERQARFRERRRAELAGGNVTKSLPVTPSNAPEVEEDKEVEIEEDNKSSIMPGAETTPGNPKATIPASPVVISIMLNDKSEYPISESDVQEWKELYPAVDILQELRKMKGWADANPSKRKTKSGIKRFINGWLAKEQDKYHGSSGGVQRGGVADRSPFSGLNLGNCI